MNPNFPTGLGAGLLGTSGLAACDGAWGAALLAMIGGLILIRAATKLPSPLSQGDEHV